MEDWGKIIFFKIALMNSIREIYNSWFENPPHKMPQKTYVAAFVKKYQTPQMKVLKTFLE